MLKSLCLSMNFLRSYILRSFIKLIPRFLAACFLLNIPMVYAQVL